MLEVSALNIIACIDAKTRMKLFISSSFIRRESNSLVCPSRVRSRVARGLSPCMAASLFGEVDGWWGLLVAIFRRRGEVLSFRRPEIRIDMAQMVLCGLGTVLLRRATVCIRAVIVGQRDATRVGLLVLNSLSTSLMVRRIEAVGNVGYIGITILVGPKGCIGLIITIE